MSFRNNKVLQVELKNPTINLVTPQKTEESTDKKTWTPDLILKILAFLTVASNGLLAILGYMHLAGYLDSFGMSLNELEIGLPTLLFSGYLSAMTGMMDYHIFSVISGVITATTLASLGFFLIFRTKQWAHKFISQVTGIIFFISIPLLPIFGIIAGQNSAQVDYNKENQNLKISQLSGTITVNTKDSRTISGTKIFATTQYTLILQKNELYKILNKGNQIVSITKFTHPIEKNTPQK
jgi:hypothetical protein